MPKELQKTPIGVLQWAKLFDAVPAMDTRKPDLWEVCLVLPANDVATTMLGTYIEDKYKEFHGNNRPADHAFPIKQEVINGKPTGNVIFKFKRNSINSAGRPVSAPKVVDCNRNPWPRGLLVGNGSTGIIAFTCFKWPSGGCGVSLYLEAVQVLRHVPYEGIDLENVFNLEAGYDEPLVSAAQQEEPQAQAAPPARASWMAGLGPVSDEEVLF